MGERHALRFAVAGAALFCAGSAAAQDNRPPAQIADDARKMAQHGDCAGSLDTFDRAIAVSIDPELRKARGVCHDKLGHPYPAIDDYRAYLTARPNAPDAEQIRGRLEALEEQVGILKEGKAAPSGGKGGGAGLEVSVSAGDSGFGLSSSGQGGAAGARNLDELEHDETLDNQAEASPLRRGRGLIFGLVFDPMNYGKSGVGWAEAAGIDFRYSFSSLSTVLFEVNFEHVNGSGTATALGGPGLELGYEARLALNPRVNDALLLGAKMGYEHLAQGASGFVYAAFQPRGRFGYRHVFGPSFGLEATLDAGVAFLHLTGTVPGTASADTTSSLIGGHLGFVLGF